MSLSKKLLLNERSRHDGSSIYKLLLLAVILLSAIATLNILIPPLAKATFEFSRSYNEGWNVFHSARIAHGEYLYDSNILRPVNYPYLWYYLCGTILHLTGSILMPSRAISLFSFLLLLLLSAYCVRSLGGTRSSAFFSATLLAASCGILMPDWIAANDPLFSSEALAVGGLLVYLRGNSQKSIFILCPLLLSLALFTKHQCIAIPTAIAIDVVFRLSRRDALSWFLAMAIFGFSLLVLGILSGGEFVNRLMAPRHYSIYGIIKSTSYTVGILQVQVGLSMLWLATMASGFVRRIIIILGGTTLLFLLIFSGGAGTSTNLGLELSVWSAIAAGLVLSTTQKYELRRPFAPICMTMALSIALVINSASAPASWRLDLTALAQQQKIFRENVAFLAGRPGDAICEDMLLCYSAGKRLLVDPWYVGQLVAINPAFEHDLVLPIAHRDIPTVQLRSNVREISGEFQMTPGINPNTWPLFTQKFMETLLKNYRNVRSNSGASFYMPNGRAVD